MYNFYRFSNTTTNYNSSNTCTTSTCSLTPLRPFPSRSRTQLNCSLQNSHFYHTVSIVTAFCLDCCLEASASLLCGQDCFIVALPGNPDMSQYIKMHVITTVLLNVLFTKQGSHVQLIKPTSLKHKSCIC
jgi:hypothetical protein